LASLQIPSQRRFVEIRGVPCSLDGYKISISTHIELTEFNHSVRGCKAPLAAKAPFDLKLYAFNLTVFQAPLSTSAMSAFKYEAD
jgi:hypothetical protein